MFYCRYISFSLGPLRFLDSLNHLSGKLECLVDNLAQEGTKYFKHLKEHFPQEKQHSLLIRKQVLPYEWITDPSKLLESKLPSKDHFYSSLTMEEISEENYNHALTVWDHFGFTSVSQYIQLYLQTDILLLADCFER